MSRPDRNARRTRARVKRIIMPFFRCDPTRARTPDILDQLFRDRRELTRPESTAA